MAINDELFDRFSLAHGAVGFGYGRVGIPWWGAVALVVGWEIVERPLKAEMPGLFPHASQDSVANMAGDVIAVMVGWTLGRRG